MLCLTRKTSQTIKIGDTITIVVHQIGSNQVRIGVEAPREVKVLRGECEPRKESAA